MKIGRVVYLESSAALSYLLAEKNAGHVQSVLENSDHVVTSVLTEVEVFRGIRRALSRKSLSDIDGKKIWSAYQNMSAPWFIMQLTQQVKGLCVRPFPVEPVRSLDAIHLATILAWVAVYPDLRVLSFDDRILQNLSVLGFETC